MKLKVRIDFNDEQRQHVQSFVDQLNRDPQNPQMSIDEFCKRAVLYAMNQAYRLAEEAERNGTHNAESGNTGGDIEQARDLQDSNSDTLSLKETASDTDKPLA